LTLEDAHRKKISGMATNAGQPVRSWKTGRARFAGAESDFDDKNEYPRPRQLEGNSKPASIRAINSPFIGEK
jgi:hypothetical protein